MASKLPRKQTIPIMKQKGKLPKFLKPFIYIFTLFIGIFVITVSTRVGRYNDSLLNVNFFIVLSDSMKPEFQANDLIVTVKRSPTNIQEGDIITYYSRDNASFGEIITHKVVQKFVDGETIEFQTKGVNNDSIDPYRVLGEDVIGVYLFKVPGLANFLFFTRTPLGYITIVVVPFGLLLTLEILEIKKKSKLSRASELNEIYQLLGLNKDSEEAKKLAKTDMTLEDVKKLIEINKK
jgi:signal peptidase I